MGLILLQHGTVYKDDFDIAREMARVVDGRIELVTDFFREFEHYRVTNGFIGKLF